MYGYMCDLVCVRDGKFMCVLTVLVLVLVLCDEEPSQHFKAYLPIDSLT